MATRSKVGKTRSGKSFLPIELPARTPRVRKGKVNPVQQPKLVQYQQPVVDFMPGQLLRQQQAQNRPLQTQNRQLQQLKQLHYQPPFSFEQQSLPVQYHSGQQLQAHQMPRLTIKQKQPQQNWFGSGLQSKPQVRQQPMRSPQPIRRQLTRQQGQFSSPSPFQRTPWQQQSQSLSPSSSRQSTPQQGGPVWSPMMAKKAVRAKKAKCKTLAEDTCKTSSPRCRWIAAKGRFPSRCGNKARAYKPKAKVPRCPTFNNAADCPPARCRWLPEDQKRKRPERCANKAPKARVYKQITLAEARVAFDKYYADNRRKNGKPRFKVPGCAKATDEHYRQKDERVITDARYLLNPGKWDFSGVDAGVNPKPVRKRRARKTSQSSQSFQF